MSKYKICPVCGEHSLAEISDYEYSFAHGRKTHVVKNLVRSECEECGVSLFLPEQLDRNNATVKAYQAELPDFISPVQILELRERYGITQAEANLIFGGGPTAFSKYERGLASPTAGTARQMLAALKDARFMTSLAEVQKVKLKGAGVSQQCTRDFLDLLPQDVKGFVQRYASQISLPIHESCVALLNKGIAVAKEERQVQHKGHLVFDYKDVLISVHAEGATKAKLYGPVVRMKEYSR